MLLLQIWKAQPGKWFGLSTKSVTGTWRDHMFKKGDDLAIRKFITANRDKNIYMTAHGFDASRRVKENAVDPCLLYSDLDECDPRRIPIRPTIAIESSPGRYVAYWVTDRPASEDLNRRLSYHIGADKSGWDRTQVLRVPGTTNYKYKDKPKVKTLWSDGPTYTIEKLEKLIPHIDVGGDRPTGDDALAIYNQYEKSLSRYARKELMNGKPTRGNRSEVLWKLNNECIEAGMTRDEAFTILWASPWNKFADRRNGEEQLRSELDKAISQNVAPTKKKTEGRVLDDREWRSVMSPMSEVEMKNPEWLVRNMIPLNDVSILEGHPGLGKSYLMQMIAMSVCDGTALPGFKDLKKPPAKVLYYDMENESSYVTKPRLVENGMKNLHLFYQGEADFSINDDEKWDRMCEDIEEHQPRLVVFDTLLSYLGSSDSNHSNDSTQAMAMFSDIARRYGCAVVLLRHLRKAVVADATQAGGGSTSFGGKARSVILVSRHPEEPGVSVVTSSKISYGKAFPSFSFHIRELPDMPGREDRSEFVWGEQVRYSSQDMIAQAGKKSTAEKKETPDEWLTELLKQRGRITKAELMSIGTSEARGFSTSSITRAADRIAVEKTTTGFGSKKESWWSLKDAG